MNYFNEKKALINKLSIASRFSKKSRLSRLIANPIKALYPKFLGILNITKEVNVQTFWGKEMKVILPEGVSTSIWRYSYFEEENCFYMIDCLRKGMTFIDIGAHFGFFSLLGSYLVGEKGEVLSFEPMPDTYSQLKENVNGCNNIKTFNYAAFNEDKKVKFFDYGLVNSAFNSMFDRPRKTDINSSNNGKEIIAEAKTIDNIIEEKRIKRVDLVKIDAESSEFQVLKGMSKTIKLYRPDIILEVGDFDIDNVPKSEKIITWLEEAGYIPYELIGGNLEKHRKSQSYEYKNLFFMQKK